VAVFANVGVSLPGVYRLTATDNHGLSTTSQAFTVSPSQLVFSRQPGSGTAGSAIAPAIVVDVENPKGKPYANDSSAVKLTVASGPGAVGGTYTVDAVNGVATFSNVLFDTAGSYTLTAEDENTTANSRSFNIVAGSVANLSFTQPPSETAAGLVISPAVVVTAVDPFGNLVTQPLTVTLSVASGPAGGQLHGVHTATLVNGVATFSGISFTVAGDYTLKAATGRISTISSDFTIDPLVPVKIAFAPLPANLGAGAPVSPIVVQVTDRYGNLVTNSDENVTLSLVSGPSGATLTGTTSVGLQNGLATFDNLTLSVVGKYTFKAVLSGLPAVISAPVSVGPGAAANIVIESQPTFATAKLPMWPIVVQVEDQFGNPITGANQVSASIWDGPDNGQLRGNLTVSVKNGIAVFNNLMATVAGSYTLTISDGNASIQTQAITVG
jgi:hypothetical protein